MTETTQQETSLQAGVLAWRAKVDQAHQQSAAKEKKEARERARQVGPEVFDKVLGQDLAEAGIKLPPLTWAAEDPGDTGRVWSATASIDGFMFRAQERYAGPDWGGYKRELYLLRLCSKDVAHGFQQTEVSSLYGFAEILDKPGSVTWTCGVCSWEAYEERENQPGPTATPAVTIAEELEDIIGRIIDQRLNDREGY